MAKTENSQKSYYCLLPVNEPLSAFGTFVVLDFLMSVLDMTIQSAGMFKFLATMRTNMLTRILKTVLMLSLMIFQEFSILEVFSAILA